MGSTQEQIAEVALNEAIDAVGGQNAMARALSETGPKTTQSTVWHWVKNLKQVPAERVVDVERATGGRVTRQRLRPDLYDQDDDIRDDSTDTTGSSAVVVSDGAR